MPGITISSGYGAGGSVVAPLVAEQLGWTLLDRAISSRVAEQLQVSQQEAEEGNLKRSKVERFFGVLAPLAGGVLGYDNDGVAEAPLPLDDHVQFRDRAESIMRAALPQGAVILGRAGAAALCSERDVLRVRLFGPPEARIEQATRTDHVDRETAERRLPEVDKARAQYVHRLYNRDIDDPTLYHLHLDSTAIGFSGCVEAILAAFRALGARPRPRPS